MNSTATYIKDKKNILSIYFTADYPNFGDTKTTILSLQKSGVDLIELGIPFSDPLADGPIIQKSSEIALENGFTMQNLFNDLKSIQNEITIPIVMMGYFNTLLAFGIENFLKECKTLQIDSIIFPDLPPEIFVKNYQDLFKKYGVSPVFLVTPQTNFERLNYINMISNAFIYVVADNSITGSTAGFSEQQLAYFAKIRDFKFNVPTIIGFGISTKKSFDEACQFANGAIIGSAFIKAIGYSPETSLEQKINHFISQIKN